ncbi:MAG: UBP-type zinc finger domain-containing protein [Actinomycetota bacterium]
MQLTTTCMHVPDELAEPRAATCEVCGETRNLRACLACGHVGCCESLQAHNTAHFRASGHPVIRSLPLGEGFTWCYECRSYL